MACGTGLGGLVGGLFNKWFGWKMAFVVQLPFIALDLVLCVIVAKIPLRPAKEEQERKPDHAGSVTLVLSIVLLLAGLNAGGNEVAWSHLLIWS